MPNVYEAWHPNGFRNLEFEIFNPILSQALRTSSHQPISFGEDRDDG
jgi:hypothetical protein